MLEAHCVISEILATDAKHRIAHLASRDAVQGGENVVPSVPGSFRRLCSNQVQIAGPRRMSRERYRAVNKADASAV
jgi:hypothetical protein